MCLSTQTWFVFRKRSQPLADSLKTCCVLQCQQVSSKRRTCVVATPLILAPFHFHSDFEMSGSGSVNHMEQIVLACLNHVAVVQKEGEAAFNQAKQQPESFFSCLTQLLCGSQHLEVTSTLCVSLIVFSNKPLFFCMHIYIYICRFVTSAPS